jgi:addiction module HigA family antidote
MSKSQETPADVLKKLMDDYQIKVSKLAELTKLSASSVRYITIGKGSVSPSAAFRLAKLFGTTPEYWLDLQLKADIARASANSKLTEDLKTISKIAKPAEKVKSPGAEKTKPAAKPPKTAAAQKPGGKQAKTEAPAKNVRKSGKKKA